MLWEYSTRWYLSGFSNAVLPYSASAEEKSAAILAWMEHGPKRQTEYYGDDTPDRDPVDTLNYKELLDVCGTATNAFVNMASAGGVDARRLLLLDAAGGSTNHVVAEVLIDGRWVIVDPSFHAILRDHEGHLLTRQQLAHPEVLREATENIPGYNIAYNYEHTAFIHLGRLPLFGRLLESRLDAWQERINWALLLERQSFAVLMVGVVLLCISVSFRRAFSWYCQRAGMVPVSPWDQLRNYGVLLFSAVSVRKPEPTPAGEQAAPSRLMKSNI